MKNRIIEICELGQPQSIIQRENEPISELIKTDSLIEDLNEQLLLHNVSQQRELLIAFSECVVKDVTRKGHEEVVDYFLKKHKGINCG